ELQAKVTTSTLELTPISINQHGRARDSTSTVELDCIPNLLNTETEREAISFAEFRQQHPFDLVGALLREVTASIPLNKLQECILVRVIEHLLKNRQPNTTNDEADTDDAQLLLYVGGEGGTGKSQVIKAITCSLK